MVLFNMFGQQLFIFYLFRPLDFHCQVVRVCVCVRPSHVQHHFGYFPPIMDIQFGDYTTNQQRANKLHSVPYNYSCQPVPCLGCETHERSRGTYTSGQQYFFIINMIVWQYITKCYSYLCFLFQVALLRVLIIRFGACYCTSIFVTYVTILVSCLPESFSSSSSL